MGLPGVGWAFHLGTFWRLGSASAGPSSPCACGPWEVRLGGVGGEPFFGAGAAWRLPGPEDSLVFICLGRGCHRFRLPFGPKNVTPPLRRKLTPGSFSELQFAEWWNGSIQFSVATAKSRVSPLK